MSGVVTAAAACESSSNLESENRFHAIPQPRQRGKLESQLKSISNSFPMHVNNAQTALS